MVRWFCRWHFRIILCFHWPQNVNSTCFFTAIQRVPRIFVTQSSHLRIGFSVRTVCLIVDSFSWTWLSSMRVINFKTARVAFFTFFISLNRWSVKSDFFCNKLLWDISRRLFATFPFHLSIMIYCTLLAYQWFPIVTHSPIFDSHLQVTVI